MMKYPALSSFFICCSIIGIFAAKSGGAQSGYDQTQGQQQTGKGPPRYAVIDLGDSSPLKIANTGQVYATQVGTTVACGYRWDQGVWSPLSNLGLDWAVTTDMNNIGTVVGYGHDSSNFNKAAGFNVDSETIGLIWPSFSSSPTSTKSGPTLSYTLNFTRYDSDAKKTYTGPVTATESFLEINFIDSAGDVYGPQYNQQVGSYLGGDQGSFFMPVENLFDFTSNDMLTDVVGTEDASGYSQTGSYGRIISASLGGVVFEHDANQQTGAPFDLILNGIVIASDPQQDSFGDDYYLNDYGAMAYTDSTSDLPMIIDGQTNSELPQYPVSINNRTVPGPGGSSIHAWQILGFEDLMEPAIDPVSHLPNGQYTQQTDTPISDLLNSEAQNAWTAFAVTGINDNGAIVGTATYTPTGGGDPIAAGSHGVLLLPVQITLQKQGDSAPPTTGVLVKKGDTVQMALNPGLLNGTIPLTSYPLKTSQVNWQYREMNGDGTFTSWTNFQATPEGPKFNYTTTLGGIYQVQAIITVNGASETWQYNRQQDDPYGSDSDGNFNPIYAKGQPDYFGVVDSQWQIDVRNQARALLGSSAYSEAGSLSPIYSGGPTFAGHDKCNIFVYQMCNAAGDAPVSLIRSHGGYSLPPLTIDWYDGPGTWLMPWVASPIAIPGWASLGQPTWPEPGYVVSRPAYTQGQITGGHAGILDYDGAWINAGSVTVNRYPNITPSGNSYNNPEHCTYHTP